MKSSSKKCPNYRGHKGEKSSGRSSSTGDVKTKRKHSNTVASTNANKNNSNGEESEESKESSDDNSASYPSISSPNFIELGELKRRSKKRCTYTPVVDVASPDFKTQKTTFRVTKINHRCR